MVILKEIHITTISKPWMEQLKNYKGVYPHTLFVFLTRIRITVILVRGCYTTIRELFHKTNTQCPDCVNPPGSPINLSCLFISKKFHAMTSLWFMQNCIRILGLSMNRLHCNLLPSSACFLVDKHLPAHGAGDTLMFYSEYASYKSNITIKSITNCAMVIFT